VRPKAPGTVLSKGDLQYRIRSTGIPIPHISELWLALYSKEQSRQISRQSAKVERTNRYIPDLHDYVSLSYLTQVERYCRNDIFRELVGSEDVDQAGKGKSIVEMSAPDSVTAQTSTEAYLVFPLAFITKGQKVSIKPSTAVFIAYLKSNNGNLQMLRKEETSQPIE
jgi:hypothetical protein